MFDGVKIKNLQKLYAMRWNIETFFREFKYTVG